MKWYVLIQKMDWVALPVIVLLGSFVLIYAVGVILRLCGCFQ